MEDEASADDGARVFCPYLDLLLDAADGQACIAGLAYGTVACCAHFVVVSHQQDGFVCQRTHLFSAYPIGGGGFPVVVLGLSAFIENEQSVGLDVQASFVGGRV